MDFKYVPYTIVGKDAQWELLRNAEGAAVVPLRSQTELIALRKRLISTGVQLVEAQVVTADIEGACSNKAGIVAWTAPEQEMLARLYAHMTNRYYGNWIELGKTPQTWPVLAIIASRATLTTELLESAADMVHSQAMLPGFIYAAEPRDLRLRALVAACLYEASLSQNDSRGDIVDALPVARVHTAVREVLGGGASTAQIREFLHTRYATLAFSTHSDGVDTKLGRSAMLCALRGATVKVSSERTPACVHTGMCHRRGIPLTEIEADSEILDPSAIACGLLVMDVCFGLLHAEGYVSTGWSLFERLTDNPHILAAAYHLNLSDMSFPNNLAELLGDLHRGTPLGQAFGDLMRSRSAHRYGIRFVLLGDPSSRAVPRLAQLGESHTLTAEDSLEPVLAALDAPVMREAATVYARNLALQLHTVNEPRQITTGIGDPGAWLDKFSDALEGWDSLHTHLHVPASTPAHAGRAKEVCFHCGHRYFRRLLSPSPGHWRTILRCENCGAGGDHSAPAQIELRFCRDTMKLEIRHKQFSAVHARLFVTSKCYGHKVIRSKLSPSLLESVVTSVSLDSRKHLI